MKAQLDHYKVKSLETGSFIILLRLGVRWNNSFLLSAYIFSMMDDSDFPRRLDAMRVSHTDAKAV